MRIYLTLFVVFAMLWATEARGQTIPVGDIREEQMRLQQLLGDSLNYSFSHRSSWSNIYKKMMPEGEGVSGWWNRSLWPEEESLNGTFRYGYYDSQFGGTVNSALPVGENNAAAWYGKGLTTELRGGVYVTSEYLTLSLQPHVVYQQNADFSAPRFVRTDSEGNQAFGSAVGYNYDRPYRFGPDPYWTWSWGHSSIRAHYGPVEAGFSTEPMWWGPAVRYPLVMSNNAPGFPHGFFGTREPLTVPYVGSFELTWAVGLPRDSDWYGINDEAGRRLFNGLNLSWSPAIFPNLHLGLIRVFHVYARKDKFLKDVFRIFDPFQKANLAPDEFEGRNPDRRNENQIASVWFRWVLPEAHAEIYGEYLKEDHNFDLRGFLTHPNKDRAYTLGIQKLVRPGLVDFVKVNLEYNHLTYSRINEVGRLQARLYTNTFITEGHTNRGQLMGAAIGPGSNSLYLGLDGYKDNWRIGVFAQRWVEDDQFHIAFSRPRQPGGWRHGDKWRHRVNFNVGSRVLWLRDPFVFTGKLMWTKAYNYGRYNYGNFDVNFETVERDDVGNLQVQFGVRYLF